MKVLDEISRTLNEYLLLPGLTSRECTPDKVDLGTGVVRHNVGELSPLRIATPMVSAIMEAVSGRELAIALAQSGGLAFIHQNQSIADQAADVAGVKGHKAGFRESVVTVKPTTTLGETATALAEVNQDVAVVTDSGNQDGEFVGLIDHNDFTVHRHGADTPVSARMRPSVEVVTAPNTITLSEANSILFDQRLAALPLVDTHSRVTALVLRRDYQNNKVFQHASVDAGKRLRVGAGINSRDYTDRVPALIEAGADVLCLDSSDGYSEYQNNAIEYIHREHGEDVFVGAGNVVDGRAFRYLADAGASFVKVGIGGGSICITRDQKGIGRGQASALQDVVAARDTYAEKTGDYIPICCDGGLLADSHMALALAFGSDFIMLGRYFARFDEAPTAKVTLNGQHYKEYWGEGSRRARNTTRYGQDDTMTFEEGVDGYVSYAGSLADNVAVTRAKIIATMISCGATNLATFRRDATAVLVSERSWEQNTAEVLIRDTGE